MARKETTFLIFTFLCLAVLGTMVYFLVFNDKEDEGVDPGTASVQEGEEANPKTPMTEDREGPKTEIADPVAETVEKDSTDREKVKPEQVDVYNHGQVMGQVADEEKKPLAGVDVILYHSSVPRERVDLDPQWVEESFQTVTDNAGNYFFPNVPALGEFQLIAVKEGYMALSKPKIRVRAGQVEAAGLLLMGKGWILSGEVRDEQGAPIPKALVFLEAQQTRGTLLDWESPEATAKEKPSAGNDLSSIVHGKKKTRTDAEGRYTFPTLGAGRYLVGAWAKGYSLSINKSITAGMKGKMPDQKVNFVLEKGRVIQGSVMDEDGQPIVGIKVRAERAGSIENYSLAVTSTREPDGRFTFDPLPAGRYFLTARKEGYLPANVTNIEAGAGHVAIVMKRTATIFGQVFAYDRKKPLTDFSVTLCSHLGTNFEIKKSLRDWERVTSEDGSFRIEGVQRGRYVVLARADGYCDTPSEPVNVADGETAGPLKITLDRGFPLTGIVRDQKRKPVVNAEALLFKGKDLDSITRILGFEGEGDEPLYPSARTDGEGKFVISNAAPGTYSLKVTHPDFQDLILGEVNVDRKENNFAGEMTLIQGGSLYGKVVDNQGLPRAGLMVRISGMGANRFYFARTDHNGVFKVVKMPPGQYEVTATEITAETGGLVEPSGNDLSTTAFVKEGQRTEIQIDLP